MTNEFLTLTDIREAHARILPHVNLTPVMTSETLDASAGAKLFFKCENLQKVGAFKARGAANAVFSLSEMTARRGVITHSSGNHAAALARAAKLRGIPAYIVMPENSPKAKQDSVRRYWGEITFCAPTLQAREATAHQLMEKTGAVFIHPYNDLRVMAGQGTSALEMLDAVPDLNVIVCPIGGGGQISGIATAIKSLQPRIQVIGVEPAGADDALRSFRAGHIVECDRPNTIADGLRVSLGDKTFAVIRRSVDDIVTVSEGQIVQAMRTIWEVMKLVVEPSGAVAYAAVMADRIRCRGKRTGLILSGGNLDLDRLPWQLSTVPERRAENK